MKRLLVLFVGLSFLFIPIQAFSASSGDAVLPAGNVRFSTSSFIEGKSVRIYATVQNPGQTDILGVVRFFDGKNQIQSDQPVSILTGKDDSVFVDYTPQSAGDHTINISISLFQTTDTNPDNNTFSRVIHVLADTDRDGSPNSTDTDDDNDKHPDAVDAFPLDKTEWIDTDGDGIGDNKDTDDDNDGVLDEVEIKQGTDPLKVDTDGDGVSDKDDAYPLDPARQIRDYDGDGIVDDKDADADNDGIPKNLDVNDTNLGPTVAVTLNGLSVPKFVSPNQNLHFDTTGSADPDGSIAKIAWTVDNKEIQGDKMDAVFAKSGTHEVSVKLTDNLGESREKSFKIYVIPPYLPWIFIVGAFVLIILALFAIISYIKPRRSRLQKITDAMEIVNKVLGKAKKRPSKK